MSIEVIETHTILPDIIAPGSIVADCGANVGRFSLKMITKFGCSFYAIEAAPRTFDQIPTMPSLYRYNFALCATDKVVMMSIDEEDTTRSTVKANAKEESVGVQKLRFGEFLDCELGGRTIDIIKMDIEGAEIEVIASLDDDQIKRVGRWTIEFHDFTGYTTQSDVRLCVERIVGVGFHELF